MSEARAALRGARRLVVKIGSSSLTTADGGLDPDRLDGLVDVVAGLVGAGRQVVVVSSGAIAAGLAPLGLSRRPSDLAGQQAAASVGQLRLAHAYQESFSRYGLTVGQVLLTGDDVVRRAHYRNTRRTFERLLGLGAVPVVNENDTVATEEIRFGDNDRLAALTAHLTRADGLVLLSDVDALYDGDPRMPDSRAIREVIDFSAIAGVDVSAPGSGVGTGGMVTKLAAARLASSAGIPVLLTSAVMASAAVTDWAVGTAFAAAGRRLPARRLWLAYAAGSAGRLSLDDGAVRAVAGRRSLLAAGVTGVEGEFEAGDVVEIIDPRGAVVARGMVAFDAGDLRMVLGRSTHELPDESRREVVHADDLVPFC